MHLKRRQIVYGTTIGAGTFIGGVVILALGFETGFQQWRHPLLSFLAAHSVVRPPENVPTVWLGYVYPTILAALGTVLTAVGISTTSRLKHIVQNGASFLYGYLGLGVIAVAESGGNRLLAGGIFVLAIILIPLYVGSAIARRIPFLGIASLGLVMSLGFILFLAGMAVLISLLPLLIVAVGGTTAGIVLTWAVRNGP